MAKLLMTNKFYFLLSILLFCPSLWANDSSIGLDSGNIVFKKSDGITMLSEDLYISPQEIRVHYEFKNETSADIKTQVGFPIPPMAVSVYDGDSNFNPDSDNPLGFNTWVNGKKIVVQMHRKADKKEGTIEFTYYWEQLFPAGKALVIEHHYQTTPTSSVGGSYKDLMGYDVGKKYCLKETFSPAQRKSEKYYAVDYANYILTTANNWKGAIGDFHLIIDKQRHDTLVSLCAKDISKISPTRFEMRKKGFKPEKDLAILFLHPM